jgi:hypothetical protein
VLTNEANVGFPDAAGEWVLDRLLGNPKVDHVGERLKLAKASAEKDAKLWVRPANPRPSPPFGPLAGSHPSGGGQGHRRAGGRRTRMAPATGALKLSPWDEGSLPHACARMARLRLWRRISVRNRFPSHSTRWMRPAHSMCSASRQATAKPTSSGGSRG